MILNEKCRIPSFGPIPSEKQINHMNLEKKVFFHFGMNTFTNAEWGNGAENSDMFNPPKVDTDQWVRGAKEAGFKLAIITTKHHDGFCLWPSEHTEHTIKNSPYQNGQGDILRQFTDSCHKYGMLVGFYISPWDRNSRYWGQDEYSNHYARQLHELMPNYGRIDEVWWDGAGSNETNYNWRLWKDIIKSYQPDAIMFGSLGATDYVSLRWVGNESGFANETHYASIDPYSLRVENVDELNRGKIDAERYIPAEVDVSIRPGWFYHKEQDNKVKSPKALDDIWFNSVGRNAMMLLNFPPNRDGVVCDLDIERAVESNKRIEKMRATNYVKGAKVVVSDGEDISEIIDTEKVYLSTENEISFDITLPDEEEVNVFALSEVFERGERITEFKVINKDTGKTVCSSTSVGRLKALRFPKMSLKNLRVEIKAMAPVTLENVYIWKYEAPSDEENKPLGENLLTLSGSNIEMNDARNSAVLNFGGIYDFNTVKFNTDTPSNYEIFGFDGSKFYSLKKGTTETTENTVKLEKTVSGCYQIKVAVSEKFAEYPEFHISET
jgi:alpha-L-fucosidase